MSKPFDPWPEQDSDPILLVVDNNSTAYDKVVALGSDPDPIRRSRAIYQYISTSLGKDLTDTGDREQARVLRDSLRHLRTFALTDEFNYWEGIGAHYRKVWEENNK